MNTRENASPSTWAGGCVPRMFSNGLRTCRVQRGIPGHIRSDNGPEFTAKAVRSWLERLGVRTLFIEPGSPWENGYVESFIGKMRDEFLNMEVFDTLLEARVLCARWRREYNCHRPHSARRPHSGRSYRPPAPQAVEPLPLQFATVCLST